MTTGQDKRELRSRNDDQDPLMPTWTITELQEWARASYHWVISLTGTQRILQKQHAGNHLITQWWLAHVFSAILQLHRNEKKLGFLGHMFVLVMKGLSALSTEANNKMSVAVSFECFRCLISVERFLLDFYSSLNSTHLHRLYLCGKKFSNTRNTTHSLTP